jgi:hypothetical protein
MSIYLVQSEDLVYEGVRLSPLPKSIWEKACKLLERFTDGSKVIFFSALKDGVRHDYLIEKITQVEYRYFYVVAYESDYSIYEWDLSIQRL